MPRAATLPDGAFVLHRNAPHLGLRGNGSSRWTPAGYAKAERRPDGQVALITPPSLVAVLHAGWKPEVPLFHPSSQDGSAPRRKSARPGDVRPYQLRVTKLLSRMTFRPPQ